MFVPVGTITDGGSRTFTVNVKLHLTLNWSFGNIKIKSSVHSTLKLANGVEKKNKQLSYLCHVDKTLGWLTDYFHCIMSHRCHFHSEFNCHIFP